MQLPDWPYHKRCRMSLSISSPTRYFSFGHNLPGGQKVTVKTQTFFGSEKVGVFTTVRARENRGRRSNKELAVKKSFAILAQCEKRLLQFE